MQIGERFTLKGNPEAGEWECVFTDAVSDRVTLKPLSRLTADNYRVRADADCSIEGKRLAIEALFDPLPPPIRPGQVWRWKHDPRIQVIIRPYGSTVPGCVAIWTTTPVIGHAIDRDELRANYELVPDPQWPTPWLGTGEGA